MTRKGRMGSSPIPSTTNLLINKYMTIQELINKLQEIPDKDTKIIIQADGLLMEIMDIRKEWFPQVDECYTIYHP